MSTRSREQLRDQVRDLDAEAAARSRRELASVCRPFVLEVAAMAATDLSSDARLVVVTGPATLTERQQRVVGAPVVGGKRRRGSSARCRKHASRDFRSGFASRLGSRASDLGRDLGRCAVATDRRDEWARFLTRDPAVAMTMQPYAYAHNHPVNRVDPSGLWGVRLGPIKIGNDGCIAGTNPDGSCRGSKPIKETGHFVSEHIGEIGVAAGCGIGFATAETGVGLLLAAATCETAIGLTVVAERTGDNVTNGRAGVLYGCGAGLGAAAVQLNPIEVLLAVDGCVLAAGVQAATERQDLRNSGLGEACDDPRTGG